MCYCSYNITEEGKLQEPTKKIILFFAFAAISRRLFCITWSGRRPGEISVADWRMGIKKLFPENFSGNSLGLGSDDFAYRKNHFVAVGLQFKVVE